MEPLFLCSEPRVLTKAASPGTHHIEFVEAEIEDVLGKVYRPQRVEGPLAESEAGPFDFATLSERNQLHRAVHLENAGAITVQQARGAMDEKTCLDEEVTILTNYLKRNFASAHCINSSFAKH